MFFDNSDNLPSYYGPGSSHNNLRISRILKCLSEMGLERLNAGFLLHVLNEQSEANELNSWGIRSSMDKWWANCIRNEEERMWIGALIRQVRLAEDGYVFTREEYEQALHRRDQTGRLDNDLEAEAGNDPQEQTLLREPETHPEGPGEGISQTVE